MSTSSTASSADIDIKPLPPLEHSSDELEAHLTGPASSTSAQPRSSLSIDLATAPAHPIYHAHPRSRRQQSAIMTSTSPPPPSPLGAKSGNIMMSGGIKRTIAAGPSFAKRSEFEPTPNPTVLGSRVLFSGSKGTKPLPPIYIEPTNQETMVYSPASSASATSDQTVTPYHLHQDSHYQHHRRLTSPSQADTANKDPEVNIHRTRFSWFSAFKWPSSGKNYHALKSEEEVGGAEDIELTELLIDSDSDNEHEPGGEHDDHNHQHGHAHHHDHPGHHSPATHAHPIENHTHTQTHTPMPLYLSLLRNSALTVIRLPQTLYTSTTTTAQSYISWHQAGYPPAEDMCGSDVGTCFFCYSCAVEFWTMSVKDGCGLYGEEDEHEHEHDHGHDVGERSERSPLLRGRSRTQRDGSACGSHDHGHDHGDTHDSKFKPKSKFKSKGKARFDPSYCPEACCERGAHRCWKAPEAGYGSLGHHHH